MPDPAPLRFTPGNHSYTLDGRRVPSVTAIVNGGVPKPALIGWAAKTVAEAVADMPSAVDALRDLGREPMVRALSSLPDEARNRKADRGTSVHTLAVEVVHGRPLADVPDAVRAHVEGYAAWLDRFDLQPVLTERMCGNRTDWYAGRFDLIGEVGITRWGLDVKTGGVWGETALQLAAYFRAEFWQDDDGALHDMPHIDRIGVLSVTDAGTDLFDMGDIDTAYAEFLAAKAIHTSSTRRKRLVGDPVQLDEALL